MICRLRRVCTGLAVLFICLTAGVFTGMTVEAQGSKTVTEALDISAKQ